jgi:hypothetical protein
MTGLTPETLRAKARDRHVNGLLHRDDIRIYDAHADAWKAQVAALREALWFEHYKDAYPDGGVNHGDCAACRLLLHAAR